MHFRGQAAFMRESGFDVHAVCSAGPFHEPFRQDSGVPTHEIEMTRQITPGRDWVALQRIRRLIRELKPDIVHSNTPKGGLLGSMAGRAERVPVNIYHIRGLPYQAKVGIKRKLLRHTEWRSCRAADEVFCVSHSIREYAIEDGLVTPEKIRVFLKGSSNGVDSHERFNPARFDDEDRARARAEIGIPADATVLGFVGRIVRDKGFIELAQAWQGLRQEFPKLHLLLVGPIEPQDPVPAELIDKMQADERVHWLGQVIDSASSYPVMDLLTLPTYREGLPNVLLEAAAMGLPTVATSVQGCVDTIVDGETGLLVPVRDAAQLRQAIARYVGDPALRQAHGGNARRHIVEHFRSMPIWEAVRDRYRSLLDAARATAS